MIALGVLIAQATSFSLDGVTLQTPAKAGAGKSSTFKDSHGNTVKVTGDDDGNVAIVQVTILAPSGTIDLPTAKAFPIAGTDAAYTDASSNIEYDSCAGSAASPDCHAYTLGDGSELLLTFVPGHGLHEAILGDRTLLKQLGLIQPGATIP